MLNSNIFKLVVFVLFALINFAYSISYFDIESLAVNCPERDKCSGYRFNKHYTERSCECDDACVAYNDCCIDYRQKAEEILLPRYVHRMVCLNIGEDNFTGVYAIANCRKDWNGSPEVQQKCEGPDNLMHPLMSAPVTSVREAITYKNRYCAQCNYDFGEKLKVFQIKMYCEGLEGISDKEILEDLVYSMPHKSWGVSRLNKENKTKFYFCTIIFDAPPYIRGSLGFCRSNLVNSCSRLWRINSVRKRCAEYTAVVYDGSLGYRNPHCAFCNFKSVDEIACRSDFFTKKRALSVVLLLDVNEESKIKDVMIESQCLKHLEIYDPLYKRCRQRFLTSSPRRKKRIWLDDDREVWDNKDQIRITTLGCGPNQVYDQVVSRCRKRKCAGQILINGTCV